MLRLLIAFFTFIIGLSNVKGQTFCIITHCGWETTQCVLDPKCWEVLTCLQVIKIKYNFLSLHKVSKSHVSHIHLIRFKQLKNNIYRLSS